MLLLSRYVFFFFWEKNTELLDVKILLSGRTKSWLSKLHPGGSDQTQDGAFQIDIKDLAVDISSTAGFQEELLESQEDKFKKKQSCSGPKWKKKK
jgi:hypothetical protein